MAVWELALLIISVTVLVVNTVNVFLTLVIVSKFGNVFSKSAKIIDKVIDSSEKVIDELFDVEE